MGRTGAYTTLKDENGNSGVPITDADEFEEFLDYYGLEPIVEWEYENEDEYPRVERKVLYGFCPETKDYGKFFIKNVHIKRNSEEKFEKFWEWVSNFCEPFEVYHAHTDNHFPDLSAPYTHPQKEMKVHHIETDGEGDFSTTTHEFTSTVVESPLA